MKRTVRYLILGVVAAALVAAVIVWRTRTAAPPAEAARTAVVERGSMLVAVAASGSVEPQKRVELTFDTPGQVAEVLVQIGDRVAAGDVLARLDSRQLELQLQQAQAALMLAQAQAAQIKAGARSEEVAAAQDSLRAAEAQLAGAAANRDQVASGATAAQIAGAQAQVASAELQKKVAQDSYDKTVRTSKDEDTISHANYDLYSAQKSLEAAQAELAHLESGANADELRASNANVAAAAAQRDAAQAHLDLLLAGSTQDQIADAEAQVATAQAALASAQVSLDNATLKAPFDGVVMEVNAVADELAPSVLPAIVLADISHYRMTVGVDEVNVGRLSDGLSAQVTVEALPDRVFTGTVESIAPVADLTGGVVSYDVVIALDPTDAPVRVDMTANVTIIVEELSDVLKIPTWVVRVDRTTGQTYVDRQVVDGTERVDVRLGLRYEGFAEVLDGLSEGDVVVLVSDSTFGFGG